MRETTHEKILSGIETEAFFFFAVIFKMPLSRLNILEFYYQIHRLTTASHSRALINPYETVISLSNPNQYEKESPKTITKNFSCLVHGSCIWYISNSSSRSQLAFEKRPPLRSLLPTGFTQRHFVSSKTTIDSNETNRCFTGR